MLLQLRRRFASSVAVSSSSILNTQTNEKVLQSFEKKLKKDFESRHYKKVLQRLSSLEKCSDTTLTSLSYFYGIKSCQILNQINYAFVLVKNMRRNGILVNPHISTVLISSCAQARDWQNAELIFRRLKKQHENHKWGKVHISAYVSMMKAYGNTGKWQEALSLLWRMEAEGVKPNLQCYNTVIHACSKSGQLNEIQCLIESMQQCGINCDHLTYMSAIRACESSGNWKKALEFLDKLKNEGITPDLKIYSNAILVCGASKQWKKAEELFHELQEKGIQPNNVVCNILLKVFARQGDSKSALDLFAEMGNELRDIRSYNSTMSACINAFNCDEALRIFSSILEDGFRPNSYSFSAAIQACHQKKDWAMALIYLQEATREGVENMYCYTNAMSVCAICGKWEKVLELLNEMKSSNMNIDAAVYSTVMNACLIGNQPHLAIELWKEMQRINSSWLDNLSCSLMFKACSMAKEYALGYKIWRNLEESGQNIDAKSYGAIIKCLKDWGKYELVLELVNEMQIKGLYPEQDVFECAISSCKSLGKDNKISDLLAWQQELVTLINRENRKKLIEEK